MTSILGQSRVLVVDENDKTRQTLVEVLCLLGVKSVDEAGLKMDAYEKFKQTPPNLVLAKLKDGRDDVIGLTDLIRHDPDSPNVIAPVIAIGSVDSFHLVDAARKVGITEMLQAPFTADDLNALVEFVLIMQQDQLAEAAQPQEAPVIESASDVQKEVWPDEAESVSMTEMLLDHYMKHHEVVLSKLKFAQDATRKGIQELRNAHEKVRKLDNTNILTFTDFETMWEGIIDAFVKGGIEEEELFKIEKLITTIPADIKEHYDELSNQDKSFLSLVESLNVDAYRKAKQRVARLQQQPNPLNGKSSADYLPPKPPEKEDPDAFMLTPKRSKK